MFKKKPSIKALAPLKSSDRRRTADQIITDFAIDVPADPEADGAENAASASARTAFRRRLLPDNSQSARFTTTAGPDLKQVSGTIYVGSHEGTGDMPRILWVKIRDQMYPTVYSLWHNPGIVPLLHTPEFVVEKLQTGADLMTPGLQNGPPFPKKATKGAVVAVASLENPTVPMAVGRAEIDISALESVRGMKGHAVETVHWAGDELWSWSPTGNPGLDPPANIEGWAGAGDEDERLTERTKDLRLEEDQEGGVSLAAEPVSSSAEPIQEAAPSSSSQTFVEEVEDKPLTEKGKSLHHKSEIDNAFRDAFIFGVRHHMDQNKDHPTHGLNFPLSQSTVMSVLVQPFLPTYTPARTASLQIKKTSWKNAKKLIKYLDKLLIVKYKDKGTEAVILDIDFNDRHIKEFVPYRLPKKETAAVASSDKPAAPQSVDMALGQKLKLVSLLRPKERLAPILTAVKADPRRLYSATDLKNFLKTYIETENLLSERNKRLVNLNPQLADALLSKSAADDKALASGHMPRDLLADRFVAATSPFHVILRDGEDIDDHKPKAGGPPRIQIVLETRSGNKMVTKVSGLEAYYVAPQPLADELRKTCAGSTNVERLQGSSPKHPVMEVMVQGPQKDAVIKALEKRGVNRNWVEVTDKTKKKK
ncbi:hypothetical protein M011DRAFT_449267 [Sporormia fimetaria CBS 119925]|uniref:SUI1 domain-containing protein n=1 Tax=Sporormia fimetaria CBS 119925 TaxID=1340428 RepID=A0A6A6V1Z7_9PLEO|nr:hypothetical protein M011DRAFT_449267 [Sporormia fimetaria CBS 119925]